MSRLIDADALKKAITQNREIDRNAVCDVLDIIDNAPTVDFEKLGESLNCQIRAEYGSCDDCELSCPRNELIKLLDSERPHGEWIEGTQGYYCSECDAVDQFYFEHDFCPKCGADMRGKEND